MISHTLICKHVGGVPHVLVPLSVLLALLGRDTPAKRLAPPIALRAEVAIANEPPAADDEEVGRYEYDHRWNW